MTETNKLPEAQEQKQEKRVATMAANERGLLIGSTLEEQFRLATAYHRSGLMPTALDSPEKVLVALQLCHELGLAPMSSIGKICVINNTPAMFGELPLSLVMRSGLLVSFKEWWFDKNGKEICIENQNISAEVYGAGCTVQRKGFDPITRIFTKDDAVKAGVWGKRVWAVWPKRMMQMKPRGHALKDMFADILGGCHQAEYDFDSLPETSGAPGEAQNVPRTDARTSGKAAELSAKLSKQAPINVTVEPIVATPKPPVEPKAEPKPEDSKQSDEGGFDAYQGDSLPLK